MIFQLFNIKKSWKCEKCKSSDVYQSLTWSQCLGNAFEDKTATLRQGKNDATQINKKKSWKKNIDFSLDLLSREYLF